MKIIFFIFFFLVNFTLYSSKNSDKQNDKNNFFKKLSLAALSITNENIIYDGSYRKLKYPNGDVPKNIGVCTDVIIRCYRKLGIDLQKEVHEDMKKNFHLYPSQKKWGLKKADSNIDHRRVPNLMKFFSRKGKVLPITKNPKDYLSGDIVCNLVQGLPHIAIVIHLKSKDGKRNLIVHNIGFGQVVEDGLFEFPIIGHYRYRKEKKHKK